LANCDLTTARKGKTMKHMAGDTLRFAVGNLDHVDFWPIFEMASHLRIPLFIHPQTRPRAVREAYYSGFDNPGRSSVCHATSLEPNPEEMCRPATSGATLRRWTYLNCAARLLLRQRKSGTREITSSEP
jgi:hypothetical protein